MDDEDSLISPQNPYVSSWKYSPSPFASFYDSLVIEHLTVREISYGTLLYVSARSRNSPFRPYLFRSMCDNAGAYDGKRWEVLYAEDDSITAHTSVDEVIYNLPRVNLGSPKVPREPKK
jgi:hypothetical protein